MERNEEQLKQIVQLKQDGQSLPQIAKIMGLTAHQISGRWERYRKSQEALIKTPAKKPGGHTLADFRAEHDLPLKIREAVATTFGEDQETYYTDQEFRELCGISVQNWRRNADQAEFARFQFKKVGDHYWAHPEMILAMKKITGAAGH